MSLFHRKYKVRPGTIDSGKDYEHKMAALLSLRCLLHGVEEMWIASNPDGVGAFDDIVLHVKTAENNDIALMCQLKHKDIPKNITRQEFLAVKGDFSLAKYSSDIAELEQSVKSNAAKADIVKYLGPFKNIYFVLFTNRGALASDVLQNKSSEGNSDMSVRFLKDVLNTNTEVDSIFGIDPKQLFSVASGNNFNNVFLLCNQISAKNIDEAVESKIKEILGLAGVAQVDIRTFAGKFIKFVTDWAKGVLGGHYCLTKQDVICKIFELFVEQFELKLQQKQFSFYDCPEKKIWNQIMNHETVTVVDSDDAVVQFLEEYVGREVRKYCKEPAGKSWCNNLSDQTLFYRKNRNLEQQMLKIVGSHGMVTLLDVYKCLWMANKLPVLLEVKKVQDYENILHVLRFSNYSYKIIAINKTEDDTLNLQASTKTLSTFKDLSPIHRNEILKLPVKLQGRGGAVLGNLVDENTFDSIKCKDIIGILLGNFTIGNNLEQLPPYFIERSFRKVIIQTRALKEINDEIFLLDVQSNRNFSVNLRDDFNACQLKNVNYNNLDNRKVILLEERDDPKMIANLRLTKKTIHCLSVHDENHLEWRWTFGSTAKIKSFQISLEDGYTYDIVSCFLNSVTIISDDPGMGKSTLMDFIEHHAPVDKWILRINLNEHQQYYRKADCKNPAEVWKHLRYFNDTLLSKNLCNIRLAQKVFEKFYNTEDVVVLLDGFDEVSVSYKDEVTELAKSLRKKSCHVWLTTRPHMATHLEREFDTFSHTLKPFNTDDQKRFLTIYFRTVNDDLVQKGCETVIRNFAEQLLEAAKKNLNDEDATFAGVPLQSKLLADVFNDDCRSYLTNKGATMFRKNFYLLYLYQSFIDNKLDILCDKFGENAVDIHSMFKKHEAVFALKSVFGHLKKLDIDRELNDGYEKTLKNIQLLQRDGVIKVDRRLNISCVHRTFAEYLAAQWLAENVRSASEKIKRTVDYLIGLRFSQNYKFLFKVFDRILAKSFPLHLAVLDGKTEKVIETLKSDPNAIMEVDDGGRSVLHVIALCGVQFPTIYQEDFIGHQDPMVDIIDAIPKNVLLDIGMDALGYTPFDYALRNASFTVAHKIYNLLETPTLRFCQNVCFPVDYLAYCAKLKYEQLFRILLPYFVSVDVLVNNASESLRISAYVREKRRCFEHECVRNCADRLYENVTLLELLQSDAGYPYAKYRNNCYFSLHYAAALGTPENVSRLISEGSNIDEEDFGQYTALHYAVLHGKAETANMLIDRGANVNAQTFSSATPLHLAIGESRIEVKKSNKRLSIGDRRFIVDKLLANNVDVNVQTYYGDSPLHYASTNGYTDIVEKLILRGANVNLKNIQKFTALHKAIEGCHIFTALNSVNDTDAIQWVASLYGGHLGDLRGDITLHCATKTGRSCSLTDLLRKGGDINMANVSLDCLYESCHYCTIVKLLSKGADINEQNYFEDTPLHVELTKDERFFDVNIVKLLLFHGADANMQRINGETTLHTASRMGHSRVLAELLDKGADIDRRDHQGNTPLHLAEDYDTASVLILNGADINAKNAVGQTPCHSACLNNRSSILKELITRGVDINEPDDAGNTALHLAFSKTPFADNADVEKLLIFHGADINRQNKRGETALHLAAKHMYYKSVVYLLGCNANANIQDNNGNTPLHFVSFIEVADLITAHGADTNIRNKEGQAPPCRAALYPYP